jgi:hypothetical protein
VLHRGTKKSQKIISSFHRLRVVRYHQGGYLYCSCCHYERVGLPCAHILRVTDKLDISMCDVRWWKSYSYFHGRHNELSKVFQVALENRCRGIPWQIEKAIGSTEYPIVGAGTNEEELSTMMYLFHSATKVLVLGHPKDDLLQPSEDR